MKIYELHHKSLDQKIIYNYPVIAQKLPMLKQSAKTINTEFILTSTLSQLSFVSSHLMQSSSQGFSL